MTSHEPAASPDRGRHNNDVGMHGETLAARHLIAQGMVLLDRNWRCEIGELDLVLREDDVLVACEVKTRSSTRYGAPLEVVGERKAARLRRLAERWVADHGLRPDGVRVDVVGVLLQGDRRPRLEHVRGVA